MLGQNNQTKLVKSAKWDLSDDELRPVILSKRQPLFSEVYYEYIRPHIINNYDKQGNCSSSNRCFLSLILVITTNFTYISSANRYFLNTCLTDKARHLPKVLIGWNPPSAEDRFWSIARLGRLRTSAGRFPAKARHESGTTHSPRRALSGWQACVKKIAVGTRNIRKISSDYKYHT